MGKISEWFNFDNIGTKIKNFAKWSCWIEIILVWIAAPITFIVLISDDWTAYLCWIPLVSAIVAPFLIWISSWILYAFGELVEDVHAIRNKEGTAAEEKAKVQAEENVSQSQIIDNKPQPKSNICQCGERFYGDTCPNCGRKAIIIQSTETRDNLRKATQCECGELHYARYCPICGKKAGASISNTEKPLKVEDKPQPKSTICKCGERFYGDICLNCGRNVKDL